MLHANFIAFSQHKKILCLHNYNSFSGKKYIVDYCKNYRVSRMNFIHSRMNFYNAKFLKQAANPLAQHCTFSLCAYRVGKAEVRRLSSDS